MEWLDAGGHFREVILFINLFDGSSLAGSAQGFKLSLKLLHGFLGLLLLSDGRMQATFQILVALLSASLILLHKILETVGFLRWDSLRGFGLGRRIVRERRFYRGFHLGSGGFIRDTLVRFSLKQLDLFIKFCLSVGVGHRGFPPERAATLRDARL